MGASWDEARRCPSDGSPGKIIGERAIGPKQGADPGSRLITLECQNTRCQYNETPWVVGINPDNTIPDPKEAPPREKEYPDLSNWTSRQRARDVVAELAEEVARSEKPGAEVSWR